MKKHFRFRTVALCSSLGALGLCLYLTGVPASKPSTVAAGSAFKDTAAKEQETIPSLPITTAEPVAVEAARLFSDIGKLQQGSTILLPLPGGGSIEGRLNYVKTHPNAATAAGGQLVDGSGTFEIAREPWGYRGFILQKKEKIAYVYSSDADDALQMARRPIGEVICEPDPNWKSLVDSSRKLPDPQKAAIYNGGRSVGIIYEPIPVLSSLPRAEATIYLDFDGEVIEGQSWEGGTRIVAPAYNLSAAEVIDIWRKVAEDYAPFEVNVTTDLQTYLRAPQGRRIRCITTTNNFASAGGVAFNNTFIESGDPCCWNFYSGNAGAVVISHEVGHTFNLAHDDTTTEGYYSGHGSGSVSWGPIMGAPYNQAVCQWSKGAYPNANQQQDDLAIIGASTPAKTDDHSDTAAQATPLVLSSNGGVSNTGVIESPEDIDTFVFTTGGGTVNLQFNGAVGSPNLDIEVKLYNSSGNLLSTVSPANNLSATLTTTLAAGTYTVTVDGVGNLTWTTGGYDDYGSIGGYTISGSVPLPGWRFRVPVNSLTGTAVGRVAPSTGSGYSITDGNTGEAFSINSATGAITVATPGSLALSGDFSLTVAYTVAGVPATATVPVQVAPLRGLKQEIWTGLSGNNISSMTNLSSYPNSPSLTRYSPSTQATYNGNNYGQKISGYLLPPETGSYTFWTSADDSSELWLSTTASSANKVRIANNSSAVNPGAWTSVASQQSAAINLIAGQRYYIEILHRERTGGDFVAVSWQTPSNSRRLIPNENLEYPGIMPNRAPWLASTTFRTREDSAIGAAVGTLVAGDLDPGTTLSSFTITGGNTGNAFALNPATGALTVTGPLSFANLPKFLLDVSVMDNGGLTRTAQIAVEIEPRAVKRELWSDIPGTSASSLTSSPNYPNNPTSTTYQAFFETPSNMGENYGQRLTGYIRAPQTGSYTFWIASDDGSALWLSTDTNPDNRVRIAYTANATGVREWGRYSTQKSAAITLEGGKFYYVEALHKEGTGGDNLAVSWSGPEFGQVILGAPHVTQDFYNHGAPVLNDQSVTVFNLDNVVATLEAKDWSDPGTTVTFTITGGNEDGAFTIDPLTGVIGRTSNPLPVGTRVLTVTATDNSPVPQSDAGTITVQVLKAGMKREVWNNLSTSQALTGLTGSLYFPQSPDQMGFASNFQAPTSFGETYGQRLSGHLVPPTTGNYTFWIASDDGSELYISSDASPTNKRRIASVTGSVNALQWTAQTSQQSVVIPLVAGQPYYIEALHKEGTGGDHLAVAWQGPSITRAVIPSTYLEYPESLRPVLRREDWNAGNTVTWTRNSITGEMEWANTILAESFEGAGLLSGNVTETGGSTWGSSAGWARNNGTATKTTTGDAHALLPFSPQSGKIYTLSLEIDPTNSPGTSDWLGLGFLNQSAGNNSLYTTGSVFPSYGQAWTLVRANGSEDGNTMQAFSTGTAEPIGASPAVSGTGIYDTVSVVLDTRGTSWVSTYYFNNGAIGSHTFATQPTIQAVGFTGFFSATANVRNFRLSTNDAPPGSGNFEGTLLSFKGSSNTGDGFSQRVTGFIVPPATGDYTFWLASDDDGQLLLSSDEDPANLVLIASVDGFVAAEAWDVSPSQKSAVKPLVAGKRYFVEVRHREGINGDHMAVAWQGPGLTRAVIANNYLEHPSAPAERKVLKREVWNGLAGEAVTNLTAAATYPASPSSMGTLTPEVGLTTATDQADSFGDRVSGYLIAPEDGRYTFWLASDDGGELWISTDENPTNRIRIASVSGSVSPQAWDSQTSQKSVPIGMIAGKRYYLEILRKEGVGGDHLAVAWQGPSFDRRLIPNVSLEHPLVIPGKASFKREVWTSIAGTAVSNLTSASTFVAGKPAARGVMTTFESPSNFGDNYGQRITGTLVAPESGNYKFWLASDDGGELWLSTDANPANRIKIASSNDAAAVREWTKSASQESNAIMLVAGRRYHIEVLHKEGAANDNMAVAWQGPSFPRQVLDGRFLDYPGILPEPAALKREIWTGVSGNNISNLTLLGTYPASPNQATTLTSFATPYNEADNYGQKVSGYLIAPLTGNYQFWIASDDASELWLSSNELASGKTRIAYATGATGVENWTSSTTQASATISLVAGQRCYIEALHKEGGGDDYMSVAWSGPAFSRQIIKGQFLEYPGLPAAATQSGAITPPSGIDTGYTFWLDFHGLSGTNRLANADSDGDGIPNSLEFVLGSRPAVTDTNPFALLPTSTVDPLWLNFEFRRSEVSIRVDPHAEISGSLDGWLRASADASAETTIVKDGFGPGVDKVIVRYPREGVEKLFFRLNPNMN